MDFESQVNAAFGDEETAAPEPLTNKQQKKEKRKHRDAEKKPRDNAEDKPKKKIRAEETTSPEECKALFDQITRYAEAFPDCVALPVHLSHTSPKPELEFELAKIQRRVNAKQDLQALQSSLVSTCVMIEMGAAFIPGQPIKLRGWSQNVSANMETFNDSLKQILCKYGEKFTLSCEATLLLLLTKNAVTTHLANAHEDRMNKLKEMENEQAEHTFMDATPDKTPVTNNETQTNVE
jgi:hypothetical protein